MTNGERDRTEDLTIREGVYVCYTSGRKFFHGPGASEKENREYMDYMSRLGSSLRNQFRKKTS